MGLWLRSEWSSSCLVGWLFKLMYIGFILLLMKWGVPFRSDSEGEGGEAQCVGKNIYFGVNQGT